MFDLNCLTLNDVKINKVKDNILESQSYFCEAIDLCMETNKMITESKKQFYRSLVESNEEYLAINEAFSDYLSVIPKIIEFFLTNIAKIKNQFIRMINVSFNKENYLKKNKRLIDKFNSTRDGFNHKGYHYSFSDNVPNTDSIRIMIAELEKIKLLFSRVSRGGKLLDYEERLKVLRSIQSEYNGKFSNDDYYNSYRANILGLSETEVTAHDYPRELSAIFRAGLYEEEQYKVDRDKVLRSYDFFINYDKYTKTISDTEKNINIQYKDLKDKLKDNFYMEMNSAYGADDKMSKAEQMILQTILKDMSQEIQTVCNLHLLAFSSKLDAFKECFDDSKDICCEAIKNVISHEGRRI